MAKNYAIINGKKVRVGAVSKDRNAYPHREDGYLGSGEYHPDTIRRARKKAGEGFVKKYILGKQHFWK